MKNNNITPIHEYMVYTYNDVKPNDSFQWTFKDSDDDNVPYWYYKSDKPISCNVYNFWNNKSIYKVHYITTDDRVPDRFNEWYYLSSSEISDIPVYEWLLSL